MPLQPLFLILHGGQGDIGGLPRHNDLILQILELTDGGCTTALAAEEPLPPDNSAAQTGDGPTPEAYIPDPEGTVTFQNLDRRMREGNLQVLFSSL